MDLDQMQIKLVLTKVERFSCVYKCAVAFYLSFHISELNEQHSQLTL